MYIDAVLKVAKTDKSELTAVVKRLVAIGQKFNVKFTASVTLDASELDDEIREYIAVELSLLWSDWPDSNVHECFLHKSLYSDLHQIILPQTVLRWIRLSPSYNCH